MRLQVFQVFTLFALFISLTSDLWADGNLEVSVSGGTLSIIGDDRSSGFSIIEIGQGAYSVEPYEWYGAPTYVNGDTRALKAGGIRRIEVFLKGGHDTMAIVGYAPASETVLDDTLYIDSGAGGDTVVIWDFDVNSDATILLGDAQSYDVDNFTVSNFHVGGYLELKTGAGPDYIDFFSDSFYFAFNSAQAGAYIDTGLGTKGADHLNIDKLFTWTGIKIVTSEHGDTLNLESVLVYHDDLVIETGDGDDSVELTYQSGWSMDWELTEHDTSVIVDLGTDHDELHVDGLVVKGSLFADGNQGDDVFSLVECELQQVLLMMGGQGDDMAQVAECWGGKANVDGGSHRDGDELLWIANDFAGESLTDWEN